MGRSIRSTAGTLAQDAREAMTLRLPKEVHGAMRTYAFATETSINEIAVRAIQSFLADQGHREEVDAFLGRAKEQYGIALDKLASM